MARDKLDEIYVLRDGIPFGPYARMEAIELLADGAVDPESLVRVGLEGRVFPAQMLMQPSGLGQ